MYTSLPLGPGWPGDPGIPGFPDLLPANKYIVILLMHMYPMAWWYKVCNYLILNHFVYHPDKCLRNRFLFTWNLKRYERGNQNP